MAQFKQIELTPGEKYYAAIGPKGSSGSTPKYIVKEKKSYKKAWNYLFSHTEPDEGMSVFIKRNDFGGEWVEILDDGQGRYYIYPVEEEE